MRVRRDDLVVWGLRLLLAAVLFGVWLYLTGPANVSPVIVPRISPVFTQLWQLIRSGSFWSQAKVTGEEILIAVAISSVGGIALGVWAARGRLRAVTLEPMLVWAYTAPVFLFYPLFLLWFGVGIWSKILYAVAGALVAVAYNTLKGVRSVDRRYLTMARAFGASRWQQELLVTLAAARPMVLAGVRVGVALCFIGVILGEILGSAEGLGYQLSAASQLNDVPLVAAYIILIVVFVALVQGAARLVFRSKGPS